ncbi:hypothetical protein BC830DRAFT_1145549 [Chytriomyces sp. MP71]|nr:hypothetical protein BC830DRAFT_1150056 [Chytriomyces sp. MP71]KAI8610497.1 hypothetical protein BC830DRAFT_1145549 [Chytriomyces sp. MP71]
MKAINAVPDLAAASLQEKMPSMKVGTGAKDIVSAFFGHSGKLEPAESVDGAKLRATQLEGLDAPVRRPSQFNNSLQTKDGKRIVSFNQTVKEVAWSLGYDEDEHKSGEGKDESYSKGNPVDAADAVPAEDEEKAPVAEQKFKRRDSLIITAERISSTTAQDSRSNDPSDQLDSHQNVTVIDMQSLAQKQKLGTYEGLDKTEYTRSPLERVISDDGEDAEGMRTKGDAGSSTTGSGRGTSLSRSTVSIGMSRWPHAQEVSETIPTKFIAIRVILLAIVLNILLLVLAYEMSTEIVISLSPNLANLTIAVIAILVILITNSITISAVDLGMSIIASKLLTDSHGYGMVICGYMQTAPIRRLLFAQSLSLNSICRKPLERVSYVWVLLELMKIMSLFAATGVINSSVRDISTPVSCIIFNGRIDILQDRTYPTLESSAGVAEYLFGKALGCMRSEENCPVDGSLFIFGPQLSGAVGSGDTIVGTGFSIEIATECQCMDISLPAAVQNGVVSKRDQQLLLQQRENGNPYLLRMSNTNTSQAYGYFESYAAIGNTQYCGGFSRSVLPVCFTNVSNPSDVLTKSTFQTDGTTASIALTESQALSPVTKKNPLQILSVAAALESVWPQGQPYELGTNMPGLMNALLYWTTSDLASFDPSLFPFGIETLYSILLRAGFQRTFNSKGSSCPREIQRDDVTKIAFNQQGLISMIIIGTLQLVASLFALALASVWFFSSVPYGPVLRIVTSPMYFLSLLCESPFWINLAGTGNAQKHVVWQQLDLVVKIGEAIETIEDPIGKIRLDRARQVKSLRNGRIYA